jgi:hypothetical protein
MDDAFFTRREAMVFVRKRKAGFRYLASVEPSRKRFMLTVAIPSVKIRKAQRKHWSRPLYFVEGL